MDIFRDFKRYADQVAETARWAARKGWAPATSTNYSIRLPNEAAPAVCAITMSGIDKEGLDADSVLAVDGEGRPMNGSQLRPSAETLLHLMLYRRRNIGAVLHTHSVAGALLSRLAEAAGYVSFSGWELLKGLEGIDRHDCDVRLPIFQNSQDMARLAAHIEPRLPDAGACYGFLLAGHGLYAWGKTLTDAKRHLEVFEYLLQCERAVRHYG
jgi:methylthioribulose-1-phosphate dehydratase